VFEKITDKQEVESENENEGALDIDSEVEDFNEEEYIFDADQLDDEDEDSNIEEPDMGDEDTMPYIEDFMPSSKSKDDGKKSRKPLKYDAKAYGDQVKKKPKVEVEEEEEGEKGKHTMAHQAYDF